MRRPASSPATLASQRVDAALEKASSVDRGAEALARDAWALVDAIADALEADRDDVLGAADVRTLSSISPAEAVPRLAAACDRWRAWLARERADRPDAPKKPRIGAPTGLAALADDGLGARAARKASFGRRRRGCRVDIPRTNRDAAVGAAWIF